MNLLENENFYIAIETYWNSIDSGRVTNREVQWFLLGLETNDCCDNEVEQELYFLRWILKHKASGVKK